MGHDGNIVNHQAKEGGSTMNIKTLGIDLAKNVFHFCAMDEHGKVVLRKRLSRGKLLEFLANLPPCLIGMEACGGAHYWAREIGKLGHEVRLISPHFVKPYLKTNKNDYNDAEAVCEAVGRGNMRFVPVKTKEQQDIQAIHRIREQLIKSRTAQVNQIRGLLGEYGIVIAKGLGELRRRLLGILEDAENGLTHRTRRLLSDLYDRVGELDERIKGYDKEIQELFKEDERSQRIEKVEGIGPVVATAIVAAVGEGSAFRNARQLSAWLGLVPRQHSTGGRERLLGISKRGDRYIRTLLIHGARSVVRYAEKKTDPRSRWINGIKARRGANAAAVALANKNARILWALLSRGEAYRPAR
jgi:transposase